jgi:hypothetical protein
LLVVSLGTKRSKSSVGKALLAFLGAYPSALNIGPREYAMICMLDVKELRYLFPVVIQQQTVTIAMITLCYLFPLLLVSMLRLSLLLKETWTIIVVAECSIIMCFSC